MITNLLLNGAIQQSVDRVVDTLQQFSKATFNQRPSAEEWSAAMVADHLLQLERRINHIIASPASSTEREPGEKLDTIRASLTDTTVRYKAPSFLTPSLEIAGQLSLISELKKEKLRLLSQSQTTTLDELCTDFPHNRLGELTRLEWLWFNVYHTERHLHQLQHILTVLKQEA